MKRFTYIISALFLLVSCTKDLPDAERQIPLNVSICFETKAGGSGSETVQPVVNSVRVLGFDANDANKVCVLNEYFPFGYTVMKAGPAYKVQMSSPITINSQSTLYDFYVVLNEGDYSLVGQDDGKTVSDLLIGIIPESSQESDFTDIYETLAKNDKTDISGNPVGEPAFLMCAKSLEFEISENDQKLPDAKELELTVQGGRTMAQIVIEKITSAPMDGYATNDAAVPLVFVKSVSLENVPSTIDWAAPATIATGATAMASITVGEAVTDANDEVYYQRIWPGYLTTTLNVNASVTQTTDARLYKWTKNNDNNWSFFEYAKDDKIVKYASNDYGRDDANKDALKAYNHTDKKALDSDKNANISKYFTDYEEDIKSFYSVTGITSNISSAITNLSYTDDIWTVNLGQKYYVPENIATEAGTATYIKVVLAVAAPSLDLSGVTDITWWPSPGSITGTSAYSYYLPYNPDTDNASTDWLLKGISDNNAKLAAQDNMHIVYNNDRDTEILAEDTPSGDLNVYIDGFYRKATGTSTITVNQNQKGGVFKWNIPDSSTNLYEFRIPVSQSSGNYSVVRNTRYKVTLHVNKDPRPSASTSSFRATKSSGHDNLGITAIVETEKINDYED